MRLLKDFVKVSAPLTYDEWVKLIKYYGKHHHVPANVKRLIAARSQRA